MLKIARLKIQLDDIEPPILRTVEVPYHLRLDDLHLVIQAAMGWENAHLYGFRFGRKAWDSRVPSFGFGKAGRSSSPRTTLKDVGALVGRASFKYVYDFGDDWVHTLRIEAWGDALPDRCYPRLLSASGRCPPEDSGGIGGYLDKLDAYADPTHEYHEDAVEWLGEGFDPMHDDTAAIERRLSSIANGLAKRQSKPATQSRKAQRVAAS